MKMFGVLFLERHVRQHSNFHGEQFEIGALPDSTPLKDGVRDRQETQIQKHRVSHKALAGISASVQFLWS